MCQHISRKMAVWLPIAIFLGSGCLGGQTGDGEPNDGDDFGGNPNTGEGGDNCEFETEVVDDVDAAGELGFAPSEVIARATGEFETSLAWQSSPQLELSARGISALTIAVEHGGREVRIRRPVARETDGREDEVTFDGDIGLFGCPVAYEIDVQLTFRTEGGGFDEVFESTLVASSPGVATFDQPIEPDALEGSFQVLGTQPPGGVVKQVRIGGTLSPLGTYGSVDGVLEYRTEGGPGGGSISDVAVGGGGLVASWPADSACDPNYGEGLTVALDTDVDGSTLSEAIESLNALFPRELSWQLPRPSNAPADSTDGADPAERRGDAEPPPDQEQPDPNLSEPTFDEVSRTTVTLGVEAAGAGCARLEGDSWRLTLPVSIGAATEDGAWRADYAGELHAMVGPDGLDGVDVTATVRDIPVETFGAASGLAGVDLTGYDYGVVHLRVDLDAQEGLLEIAGADVAECAQQPPEQIVDDQGSVVGGGSAGCRGTDFIPVRRAEF